MRTLHHPKGSNSILQRLETLNGTETRQWGTMTESQMLKHCRKQIGLALGKIPSKPMFPRPIQWLSKVTFGYYIPWPKNLVTAPEMMVAEDETFEIEREKLLYSIQKLVETDTFHPHPIFGNMNKEDWGKIAYKHLDHHLRQFGA